MLSIVLFVVTICMREQQSLCYYERLHGKHRALHRRFTGWLWLLERKFARVAAWYCTFSEQKTRNPRARYLYHGGIPAGFLEETRGLFTLSGGPAVAAVSEQASSPRPQ